MLKKLFSGVLMAAVAVCMLAAAGCKKDEIKTHRHVEVHDQVIDQHEVVE